MLDLAGPSFIVPCTLSGAVDYKIHPSLGAPPPNATPLVPQAAAALVTPPGGKPAPPMGVTPRSKRGWGGGSGGTAGDGGGCGERGGCRRPGWDGPAGTARLGRPGPVYAINAARIEQPEEPRNPSGQGAFTFQARWVPPSGQTFYFDWPGRGLFSGFSMFIGVFCG